jgi:hypothetical protein
MPMLSHTPFDGFANDYCELSRAGDTDEWGDVENEVMVLRGPCDFQSQGRALERLQQIHESADALVFCQVDVAEARPNDQITIETADGRVLEGTVIEVYTLDDKLLVTLL